MERRSRRRGDSAVIGPLPFVLLSPKISSRSKSQDSMGREVNWLMK
jgi:hypothetical protein